MTLQDLTPIQDLLEELALRAGDPLRESLERRLDAMRAELARGERARGPRGRGARP